ncbi:MAG: hypothetical protein Q8N69_02260 [bacterium]|nr:hypothetical protein [bacterium]
MILLFLFFLITEFINSENIYLSPNGGKTIQQALDEAGPGQTIFLSPGIYYQDTVSKRSGTADSPIKIIGGKDAVVKGSGNSKIFEINHDHIVLDGFTIDGLDGSPDRKENYRDMLIYITGGIDIKILNMDIKNAGGECVRLKYFSQKNEIAHNNIENCGVYDFKFKSGGKNGEGIYIGTAPEQLDRNPTRDLDASSYNHIHHNLIDTRGNEGVDIKEGSSGNIVEYNIVTGQKDSESAGLDSRGDENIFRHNEVYGSFGAGIRLGGDLYNNIQFGKNNSAYENKLYDNAYGAIKIQAFPQGKICANAVSGNGDGSGTYGAKINIESPCR